MPTECISDLFGFASVERRRVEASFDGGSISSNAGAVLLGLTDCAVRLVDRLAECFRDRRQASLVQHEVRTLVGQRVFGLALGYEDLVDHDWLRHDPVMAVLVGKLAERRRDCAPAAGKSARGEMGNRIKECQLDLFADRTSTATMRANQLRLWFASMAYVLLEALRRLALQATGLANATCGSIRLKLLKIGALVRISVCRVRIAMGSGHPWQRDWGLAYATLGAAR